MTWNPMKSQGEATSKFLFAYTNLPEPERAIAIVDCRPYARDAANNEINAGTESGRQILGKMKMVGII